MMQNRDVLLHPTERKRDIWPIKSRRFRWPWVTFKPFQLRFFIYGWAAVNEISTDIARCAVSLR